MKKKLSLETKTKLIYSLELIIIALVLIVFAVLKLTGVIPTKPTRLLIYNIITTVGGAYFIFDFIWVLVSKKKRAKSSLLDKILMLPGSFYLIAFDIICFIDKAKGVETDNQFVVISISSVFLYIAAVYLFQGIYHFYHPIPMLEQAIEEALEEEKNKELEEQEAQENKEETPEQ